jgi:hypothetical protein
MCYKILVTAHQTQSITQYLCLCRHNEYFFFDLSRQIYELNFSFWWDAQKLGLSTFYPKLLYFVIIFLTNSGVGLFITSAVFIKSAFAMSNFVRVPALIWWTAWILEFWDRKNSGSQYSCLLSSCSKWHSQMGLQVIFKVRITRLTSKETQAAGMLLIMCVRLLRFSYQRLCTQAWSVQHHYVRVFLKLIKLCIVGFTFV